MTYKDFVEAAICNLSQPVFEGLKQLLLEEYISFSIIDREEVTVEILAEKVCDYFGTLEIKTGKSFDKHIESYLNDLDSIVGPHIAKTPRAKKGNTTPVVVPRSRKYYEKAISTKGKKEPTMTQLVDYSRIMMCLYTAAIKNEGKLIDNFDYAADCLVPEEIIQSLKREEVSDRLPPFKKNLNTKEPYSDAACTVILSILILCSIVNRKVEGETNHE